jgi:F-type H+-transporting ATPase subunit delta
MSILDGQDSIVAGVAGRYATALFELARDENPLDKVARDLTALGDLLKRHDNLRHALKSPLPRRAEHAALVKALAERAHFSPLTAKILGLLAQRRRLNQIETIIEMFMALLAKHRGEVRAQLTSAHPLTEEQVKAVRKIFHDMTKRDVKLDMRVDDNLIGGVVLRYGSRMIDTSLRTKLNNLKLAMKEVG